MVTRSDLASHLAIHLRSLAGADTAWQAMAQELARAELQVEALLGHPSSEESGLIGCGHPVGATGARMLLDAARQVASTSSGSCSFK